MRLDHVSRLKPHAEPRKPLLQASTLLLAPVTAKNRPVAIHKRGPGVTPSSAFYTGASLRIRIKKLPNRAESEPFDVAHFEVGKVYEVGPRLAEYLIVAGYAEPEMRAVDRAADGPKRRSND